MTDAIMTIDVRPHRSLADPVGDLFRREPLFAAAGFLHLGLMLPMFVALLVDDRMLAGVNVWEKPLKFDAAIFVYLLSLAFVAHYLPHGTREKRWYRLYSAAIVAGLFAETIWIGFAASQGTASHFNETSAAWMLAYSAMGATAVMFTLAMPVFAWQIGRNPATGLSPAVKASIVQGLFVGGVLTIAIAGFLGSNGSHLVGGNPSDAEAFPIMGWSRDGGDLRVAHFFATHALQFIPAFGLLSALTIGKEKTWPVTLFTVAFVAFTLFTFMQALSGQPFLPAIG